MPLTQEDHWYIYPPGTNQPLKIDGKMCVTKIIIAIGTLRVTQNSPNYVAAWKTGFIQVGL